MNVRRSADGQTDGHSAGSHPTIATDKAGVVAEKLGDDQDPDGLLKIGTVAARLGISERTLRYYEEVGLICPYLHRPGASRRYCAADVERVRRIRELQNLMGFNLEEIRRIVAAEDRLRALRERFHNSAGDDQQHLLEEAGEVLTDLRAQVQHKIGLLTGFLEELDARILRHRDRRSTSEP